MSLLEQKRTKQQWRVKAWSYALIYVALAGLWILLSGQALDYLVSLTEIRTDLEIYKGMLFVLITGLALYALLRSWQNEWAVNALGALDSDVQPSMDSIKLPVLYLLCVLLIVASGGYVVFQNLKQNEMQKIEKNLSTVASLKVAQIDGWLKQNANFAAAAGNGSYLASSFDLWVRTGNLPKERMQWVSARLDSLRQSYPYGELTLYDLNGKPYMSTGGEAYDFMVHAPALMRQVIESRRQVFGKMHWHTQPDGTRYVSLPLASPLAPAGKGGPIVGVLVFELNPEQYLFPIVESWPTPSKSAETVLVQRDGSDLQYLNELRQKKGSSLSRLDADANPNVLAVQAVRGKLGFMTGVDYRGVEVTGYAQAIPNTDWLMVAKIDTDEIEQPIHKIAVNVTLTAFILSLVGSLSLYFWWRQRKAQYVAARMAAELQQQMLEKQIDFLSKHANDIILLMDKGGCIVEANDRAVAAYGYAHPELIGKNIVELRSAGYQPNFNFEWEKLQRETGILFESEHQNAEGKTFPVEVSSRLFETDKGVFIQSIIRDISERKRAESALRQSEARFRRIAEEAPFPSMLYAEDGEVILVNQAWLEVTGYSITDIPTIAAWTSYAHGELAPKIQDAIKTIFDKLFKGDTRLEGQEHVIRCKNGTQRVWYFVSSPMGRLPDGRRMLISMAMDMTERKKAEEDLRLAATVFESSHSGIMITDELARIVAINPALAQITGYAAPEIIGSNPSILQSGRQGTDFYSAFWSALERTGRWQGEIWNCRKNGEEYAVWLSVSALRDANGVTHNYIGIADDITESKENQSRIEFLAYHDALTGLPNRMLANDRLEQAMAHAYRSKTRVAVMFLDLDDFKTINDTLGHSTGDRMLTAVADRLRHAVRATDTVSRQGGDEFLVMLSDVTDLEAINNVAIEILDKVNKPYLVDEHELTISTSIGIAVYPDDGQNCDTLLKNADMAMYKAKQSGRNTHRFFAEEMNSYAIDHLLIRNGLSRAIENQEFLLHYQPQLDLASGKLVGAEALIRWQHPELGMVPPNRFIPVAEESGMIIPIGNWVLQEACRQAVAWQKSGWTGLAVGVNISAVQFRRGDLEQIVSAALTESGLAPQYLELELTESILIQDVDKSLEMIRRLKDLGVRLSIDDFGTGYSSLAYLRQLPVDKLKIDQSFVREITTRQDDAAIALSIITLAHTLHKRVIAEGVETIEQLRFLQEHCCDEMQGYLFSRPLSQEGFADFLNKGAPRDILWND